MFLQAYPEFVPQQGAPPYIPRIYGFRISGLRGSKYEVSGGLGDLHLNVANSVSMGPGKALIEDKKGKFLFYKTIKTGKITAELLPEITTTSIKKLPISRPMRWGDNKIHFVRPVHWVVMLFGTEIIHTQIFGIRTSTQTYGHRFHHPKALVVAEADLYERVLAKQGFVIADIDKRRQKICDQIITEIKKDRQSNQDIKDILNN